MKRRFLLTTMILCFALIAQAQNVTVTGTVTDTQGEPLIGVNIVVEGTTTGTITDVNGNYELEVGPDARLTFSYVGYETQTVAVGDQRVINVSLVPGAALDEVVVVGYGTMRKSDLTGSLASVTNRDFEQQPLTRVDQALQGRASGVAVTQTSGKPGAGFKIRIRGSNSISGNNAPLYVVDGLAIQDINSININDVASMEVLKDASATAIYGSRGANGVVLITTKTGVKGPARVSFETYYGISKVFQRLDVMTPAEFAEGVNFAEGLEWYTPQEIADLQAGGGEDWQDRLFRKGPFWNAQLSVSGGSDAVDYFISANYYDAQATIIDQSYTRYAFRTNVNARLSDKVNIGINTYMSREKNIGAKADLALGLSWDPTTPAFDENGNYNYTPLKPGTGNGSPNPLIIPENNVVDNFDNHLITSGYFNYSILDGLVLNISGGYEGINSAHNSYTPIVVNNIGNASVVNRNISRIQNTNRLTYSFDNPNHRFQVDVIHEQQLITRAQTNANSVGFFSDFTTYKDLSLGAIQTTASSSSDESLQSFLGRINYSLLNRFLFTASVRADGSSKFQKDNRWGVFPSGSVAWRLSEEDFINRIDLISNLKLRASYGVTGSQAVGARATRSIPITSRDSGYPFSGQELTVGVAPSDQLANPDLTWETTTQANVGLDLGLWSSRLTFTLDVYKKNTTDLLLQRILPAFVGPTRVTQNAGEVENKGFDIHLGLILLDKNDWDISSNLNFSRNVNEVIALVDDVTSMELGYYYSQNTFPVNPTRVEIGQPISSFRGYLFEGVYQLGEEEEAALYGKVPGQAKYQDVNDDGVISSDDIVTVGDGNPAFTWGWNWNIRWKIIDLNFLLLGSHGNDIYNFQRMRMMGLGGQQFHAVHADYNDRWTETNPSDIPAGRNGTEFLSSQFIEDGSYVTLKNLTLGCNLNNVLNVIGLETLRLYLSVENLFIITGYSGFDPESTAAGNFEQYGIPSDVDIGIDYNNFPLSRSISFGLRAIF
jgi:TonB-linked SusC/RagA family outer membrane protein